MLFTRRLQGVYTAVAWDGAVIERRTGRVLWLLIKRKVLRLRIPTDFGQESDVKSDTVSIQTGHGSDGRRTVFRSKSDSFEGAIGMVSEMFGMVFE